MDFIGLEDGGVASLGPVTSGDLYSSTVASEILNNNTSYAIEGYTDVTMVMLMADADAVSQEVGSDPLELGPSPLFPLHPRRPPPQHLHRGQQLLAGGV